MRGVGVCMKVKRWTGEKPVIRRGRSIHEGRETFLRGGGKKRNGGKMHRGKEANIIQ